jgi:hypothetical protein
VRHLALALLIALLPLRGWMGDVMATQMAAHLASQAVAKVSATGHEAVEVQGHHEAASTAIDMPPDCLGHSMEASDDQQGSDDSACANCSVCQACHTVAMTVTAPVPTAQARAASPPSTYAAQFASAEPIVGQKPPIS